MITIALADDHRIVREGVRMLLESEPDFVVVGDAADGLAAVALVEQLQPAVLIADVAMPGLSGLEVTRQVAQQSLNTRIIILSMHDDEAYVLNALRNGASGYVLKDASTANLVRAVREVVAGRRYLSPSFCAGTIDSYLQNRQEPLDRYDTLTPREREVLRLAAAGHDNIEIAEQLSISPRTAESHRANMLRKLELRTPADLIRYALRKGIIPLDI